MDYHAIVNQVTESISAVYHYFQGAQLRPAFAHVRPGGLETTLMGAEFQRPFAQGEACKCTCGKGQNGSNEYYCDQ